MNADRYALISVFDKTGIVPVARSLISKGYTIISSGGTYSLLKSELGAENLLPISEVTGAPEILDGRVKTLHPKIYGGILSRRTADDDAQTENFRIDIVIVNLYPFEDEPTTEMIDIGGVSLLRAAAKNWEHVLAICDPDDYEFLLADSAADCALEFRRQLASKTFSHIENYDAAIARSFRNVVPLKYGMNPHQKHANLVQPPTAPLEILCGTPGYINFLDAFGAWQLVREATRALPGQPPVVASFKHTSPAGVAIGYMLSKKEREICLVSEKDELSPVGAAYVRARNCDPLSSFGDFVACSHRVDFSLATQLRRDVSDGIIAPDYDPAALEMLRTKKDGRFIILKIDPDYEPSVVEKRRVFGFELTQERNCASFSELESTAGLSTAEITNIILGNIALKYTQSNAIALVFQGQVIGVGAGQQNRLECVKLAAKKARMWHLRMKHTLALETIQTSKKNGLRRQQIVNAVYAALEKIDERVFDGGMILCSDAFFPARDNIDYLTENAPGVAIVCHPGGSIADDIVAQACADSGRKLILTGKRLFTH